MTLDELINHIQTITSLAEFEQTLHQLIKPLGYDQAVYHFVNDHPKIRLHKEILLYSYPLDWCEYYVKENCIAHDPVINCLKQLHYPHYWSTLKTMPLSAQEKHTLYTGEDAGLYHGMTLPLYGSNGETAFVALASKDSKLEENPLLLNKAYLIAQALHQQFCQLAHSILQPPFHPNPSSKKSRQGESPSVNISHLLQSHPRTWPFLAKDCTLLERIFQALQQHYANDQFNVAELALQVYVSKRTLERRLAKLGFSASQVILEYRLYQALQLIEQHNTDIEHLPYQVGMDANTFHQAFQEAYHTAASAYHSLLYKSQVAIIS